MCTDLHKYIYTDTSLNWLMFLQLMHYYLALQKQLSADDVMVETHSEVGVHLQLFSLCSVLKVLFYRKLKHME